METCNDVLSRACTRLRSGGEDIGQWGVIQRYWRPRTGNSTPSNRAVEAPECRLCASPLRGEQRRPAEASAGVISCIRADADHLYRAPSVASHDRLAATGADGYVHMHYAGGRSRCLQRTERREGASTLLTRSSAHGMEGQFPETRAACMRTGESVRRGLKPDRWARRLVTRTEY